MCVAKYNAPKHTNNIIEIIPQKLRKNTGKSNNIRQNSV